MGKNTQGAQNQSKRQRGKSAGDINDNKNKQDLDKNNQGDMGDTNTN